MDKTCENCRHPMNEHYPDGCAHGWMVERDWIMYEAVGCSCLWKGKR